MKSQDYKNHIRMHPVYHYVLSLLVLVTLVAAITNMVLALIGNQYSSSCHSCIDDDYARYRGSTCKNVRT